MKKIALFLVFVSVQTVFSQAKINSVEELKNWLPANLVGFTAEKESYAAELVQDNAPYFLVAKKYGKDNSVVSVVIFDYRKPSERVKMGSNSWVLNKQTEEGGISTTHSMVAGCKTQEFVDKSKNTAQLYLYHGDRYLITLASSTENVSTLKTMAENLQLSRLPL